MLKQTQWHSATVILGKKIGRKLGFPTINLDKPNLLHKEKEGVYACLVKFNNQIYRGLLYYGPRLVLGERENILEIYLFDFKKNIYDQVISFQLKDYIRPVKKFVSLTQFQKQLIYDCRNARKFFQQEASPAKRGEQQ